MAGRNANGPDGEKGQGGDGSFPEAGGGLGRPAGGAAEEWLSSDDVIPLGGPEEPGAAPWTRPRPAQGNEAARPEPRPGHRGAPPASATTEQERRKAEEELKRREAEQAPLRGAEIADADVLPTCFAHARAGGGVIALLGYGGTGKTFIVQRLAQLQQKGHYSLETVDGRHVDAAQGFVDRSTRIMGYRLRHDDRERRAPSYLILDLPGERFDAFQQSRTARGDVPAGPIAPEELEAIAAVLALARVLLLVMPAKQVLARDRFLEEGDVEQLERRDREMRARNHDRFINGLATFRDFVLPLRAAARADGEAEALRAAIAAGRQSPPVAGAGQLDLVAEVVLTRSDEYAWCLPPDERDSFDADPLGHVAARRPELIRKLATQFPNCGWRFVAASVAAHDREFHPETPHWGMADLAAACLAASLPRQRGWWPPLAGRAAGATTREALLARAARDPVLAKALA